MEDILLSTKKLLKYLYLNGYNDKDLSLFVPKASPRPAKPHLPTIWTKDDIENILSCIDVASPTGKRDYAMILLIARLGIRVGDITRLTFENINWERNTIEFNQLKTKTPLSLPLFEDVGNAIIDYVKNGRPVTDSNVVFVKHQVPYTAFSENSRLYAVFNQYLNRAGIAVAPDKSRGVHTLRHTLAVDLLQKEVPLPVISQVLGHQSVNSTSAYLRVDVEQLRQLTIGGEVEYAN
jgi:integrase